METLMMTSVNQGAVNENVDRNEKLVHSMSSDCQKPFKSVPECSVSCISDRESATSDSKYSDAHRVDKPVPQVRQDIPFSALKGVRGGGRTSISGTKHICLFLSINK